MRRAPCRRQKASWTRWIPFTTDFQLTVCSTKPCVASCACCLRRKPDGGLKRTCRLVAQLTSTWRSHGALTDHSELEFEDATTKPFPLLGGRSSGTPMHLPSRRRSPKQLMQEHVANRLDQQGTLAQMTGLFGILGLIWLRLDCTE